MPAVFGRSCMRHQDIRPEISTKQFSTAGLVAGAADRHLVTAAASRGGLGVTHRTRRPEWTVEDNAALSSKAPSSSSPVLFRGG